MHDDRERASVVRNRQHAWDMSDGFQYFDIIIFAMIAAFLVLRLRSVLGRRTGTEKPREFRPLAKPATDNVVNLPEGMRSREELAPPPSGPRAASPEAGLAQPSRSSSSPLPPAIPRLFGRCSVTTFTSASPRRSAIALRPRKHSKPI